ncbi:MAG TPA: hypothetical protein VHS09_15885, partial [Polyangiaceae bacterium]|nr:hypothetical protein [Polyangiaceae bacterium]
MSDVTRIACAERILESPSAFLAVELRNPELGEGAYAARAFVEQLRKGCLETGRSLGLSVFTNMAGLTSEACDWLVTGGMALTLAFDGPRAVHDANRAITGAPSHEESERWVREIHARHQALGRPAATAYVNALVTVTRAT